LRNPAYLLLLQFYYNESDTLVYDLSKDISDIMIKSPVIATIMTTDYHGIWNKRNGFILYFSARLPNSKSPLLGICKYHGITYRVKGWYRQLEFSVRTVIPVMPFTEVDSSEKLEEILSELRSY